MAVGRRVPPPSDQRAGPSALGTRPLGPGSPALAPGTVEGAATQQVRTVFPPWVYPPPGAQYFFQAAQQVIAVGPQTVELTNSVFSIPRNSVGVIRELTLNVNALLATSNITFRLLVNAAVWPGYVLPVFPRAASSISISFPAESTTIIVPDGARISFQVQVVDAVSYQLGASYRGWYYSKEIARRFGYAG